MTQQQPLGSSFGAASTATEVLAGVDLAGTLAMVTGGYSGLGIETVRALTRAGAEVIVPARRPDVARQQLDDGGLSQVAVETLDLSDQAGVRDCAQRFLDTGRSLNLLINNAAVMACPEGRVGDGWERQLATNHLGHFALATLLWPALVAGGGARVVSLSSTGHKLSPIRFDDPMFTQEPYDKWQAYGQAKTANSLFAVGLDGRGAEHSVRAFAVHPGGIMTPLQRHLPEEEMRALGWLLPDGSIRDGFKTPEQGAATSVWAATSGLLAGEGGVYCEDCDVARPTDPTDELRRFRGVDAHAVDPTAADRLWQLSVELTGADLPS